MTRLTTPSLRGSRLRRAGFWRQVILNTGAMLGGACILATLAATVFGITPLVFRSGSMAPTIPTGALALSHTVPASDVHRGDVVSVLTADGVRVTHRVVAVKEEGRAAELVLKGDANRSVDLTPYRVTSVKRVVASVPRLGYAVAALSSPVGVFTSVGFVVVVLFLGFGGSLSRAPGGPGSRRTALRLAALASTAVVLGAVAVPLTPTLAYFSDTATLATGTFSMAQVPTSSTYCKVVTASGTTVSGFPCAVTKASCTTYDTGTNQYIQLTLSFTGTDSGQYDGSQLVVYRVDLAALGCTPPGWSWTHAGTLAGWSIAPVAGYQCSSLPVLEASSPRYVIGSTAYTQIVLDRRANVQGQVSCG